MEGYINLTKTKYIKVRGINFANNIYKLVNNKKILVQ